MSGWTWRYENADGEEVGVKGLESEEFPSQAEAESWVGETWHELVEKGVDHVTLLQDDQVVYGPMSLRPVR
jgi:hypothetical protein